MIAAFDFDNTVINVNSDTYIDKLVSTITQPGSVNFTYPTRIEDIYQKHGWTARMQAVFDLMHEQYQITESDFQACLNEIKIDDSMKELFRLLKERNYELIIISDANTIFIETILIQNGLEELFNMKEGIYTNKAVFDETGRLKVFPFSATYNKDGEPFDCSTKICTGNICKGTVYQDLMKSRGSGEVPGNIYVGDGTNDYCPGLGMKPSDYYFVRKNFSLYKRLQKPEYSEKLQSKVVYWNSAQDILESL